MNYFLLLHTNHRLHITYYVQQLYYSFKRNSETIPRIDCLHISEVVQQGGNQTSISSAIEGLRILVPIVFVVSVTFKLGHSRAVEKSRPYMYSTRMNSVV